MLKYWAKLKFLLLHVAIQQKIIAPIGVLPAYSQTIPKQAYMLLVNKNARVDNTLKVMNKHSHRARTKHSPSTPTEVPSSCARMQDPQALNYLFFVAGAGCEV